MAKVRATTSVSNLDSLEDVRRYVQAALSDIVNQVNGQLLFGDNVRAYGPVNVVFSATNTDTAVSHNFVGGVPSGFLVINATAAMHVYQGVGAWNKKQIFLRSDATGTATVILI